MSASDQLSRAAPYLERLLNDDYIHDQLGDAVAGFRRSRRRAKGQAAAEAFRDRGLRKQLVATAGSLIAAGRALGEPEPPKRHWFRRVLVIAAAGVGATLVWQRTTDNPTA